MPKQMSEKEREAALKKLREEISEEIALQLSEAVVRDGREPPEGAGPKGGVSQWTDQEIRDDAHAKRIVEAVLFTAAKPVTVQELKRSLAGFSQAKIENIIQELQAEYVKEERSFRIQEIAGGFECSTDPEYAPWILKLERERKVKQATQSALETLAILAYKQPVTRAEIEDLRGVDVSGVLATLLDRNLIRIVGKKEVPGRPFLYGTTDKFLEHFGLKSLKGLPDISEIKSLVEHSVRKEELLRTEKMISTEDPTQSESGTNS